MSLNVPPIQVAAVLDPRLEFKPKEYVALKGATVSSWQVFPSTSVSSSSVQVTCNPPSREMAISRLVFQRCQFDITVTGTNVTAGPLLTDGAFGPRAMPLAMVSNALQVTFNNVTVTQSPLQQYWGALMWLGENDHANRFGQYSLTPSMLDQAQSFQETFQTVRNPLGNYFSNSFENTRGGFSGLEVLSNPNAGTSASLRLTVVEPILVSPLVSGHHSNFTSCLSNIMNMSYQLNFGDLRRVLCIDNSIPGINILSSGINVSVANFSLIFQYFTPDPLYKMPSELQASYFNIVSYPTSYQNSVLPGEEITIPFNSVQLSAVPRRIIIFARERDQDRDAFSPDTYLSLPQYTNPLSITYDNNQFLNQATTEDLYNIHVKNGGQMSYSQFTRHTGSIIILDAGVDFGLAPQDAPGVLKNVQLGMTCRFVNTSQRELNVQMFVLIVYEGVMNINNGNTSLMIGVLSPEDVLNAERVPGVSYKRQTDVYGGNFFRSLRNALVSAHRFVKDNRLISRVASHIPHPKAQIVARAAKQLGYGGARHMRGGNLQIENNSEDDNNESNDEVEEYQKPKMKEMIKKITTKKQTGRKIIKKASDLAEDY